MRALLRRKPRHALAGEGKEFRSSKFAGLLEVKGVRNMQQCRCTTTQHDNHPGKTCDKPATTDDGYCKECHDKAAKEHAVTEPDMLSYQPR